MINLTEIKAFIPLFFGLMNIKSKKWQSEIRTELRFILCGIFSYMAYAIFSQLGPVMVGNEEKLVSLGFEKPGFFILAVLVIFLGYIGLLFSIVAGALYASLLPKT